MVSDTQDNGNSTPPKDQPGSILDQANTIDDGSDQDSSKFRPGSVLYHLAKIGESNTTSHGAAILAALARFHNEKTGKCNPSHKALAKQSKYGERTIRKILKEDLADLVTYQHGKYSNEYTLFPPMLVSSPAPGTITVAHAEAAPTLGTRGPGEKSSHSAHGARFTRHTGPGSLGTRGPGNIQGTYKEHSFVEDKQQQQTSSPPKDKAIQPTLEALQTAFQKRGFSSGQAKTEAKRFSDYNNEKNWRLNWRQGVERWRPTEPGQQTTKSRPVPPTYKPPQMEEHTPEKRESNLAMLRGVRDDPTPKPKQVGKIISSEAQDEDQRLFERDQRRYEAAQAAIEARRKSA